MLHLDVFHFILAAKLIMFKRIQATNRGKYPLVILGMLLIVLYMGATWQVQVFHGFFHDHEEVVSHSEEQEKDPCHRQIYHHEPAACASHDAHLIASDKCQICDLAFHTDQTLLSKAVVAAARFEATYFAHCKISLGSYWAVISSSRAPPIAIS
jgi:hypothetical protein